MKTKRFTLLLTFVMALALLLAACGDSTTAPASQPTKSAATTATTITTAASTTTAASATTAAATTATTAASLKFSPYTSPTGGFSIQFPATPTEQKQNVASAGQTVEATFVIASVSENISYIVSFNDLPASVTQNLNTDSVINAARDGQAASISAKVSNEKSVTQGQYVGKEFELTTTTGTYGKAQIYVGNGRQYQVIAVYANNSKPNTADLQTYFSSFKITQTAAAATTTAAASGGDMNQPPAGTSEVQLSDDIKAAFGKSLNITGDLEVKMYASDSAPQDLATQVDGLLTKAGYTFALPGATKPTQSGDAIVGLYTQAGQPDVLLTAGAVPTNATDLVSVFDLKGLSDSAVQSFAGQLQGKKSGVVVIIANDLLKTLTNKP